MAAPSSIIVIGASAGGHGPLMKLAAGLPADFAAAIFIVVHIGPHKSQLPSLLSRAGPLPAVHAEDGDEIQRGVITLAPPDRHLFIEPGRVRLTRGPRENWSRPAIDPLFRSAADVYGPDVIGVILSGGLDDGAAGLYHVKARGGVAIVQDPDDAAVSEMPESALAAVAVDHCLPAAELPRLLTRIVAAKPATASAEAKRAAPKEDAMTDYTLDQPVALTCPDCGGAMRQDELGDLARFRCHIGHVFSADVMVAAQFLALEHVIESALRTLSERAELCRQLSEKSGDVAGWQTAMREALEQTRPLREMLEREWVRPERNIEAGAR